MTAQKNTQTTHPANPNPQSSASQDSPATGMPKSNKAAPENMLTIVTVGELLDDLQLARIANGNRIAALEREFGGRWPHLDEIQAQLAVLEHDAELELKRAWRKHPLAPWAADQHGVGEKSIARLVAIIGDPGERPNVAKLWAYCGHGDPARKPRRGMSQDDAFALGNPKAKKQVWLVACGILKAGVRTDEDGNKHALSPAAQIYLDRREATKDRLHGQECKRCGPAGHPAAEGSPWSAAHQHADALRVLGKHFLKELWIASRQSMSEDQRFIAGGKHDA